MYNTLGFLFNAMVIVSYQQRQAEILSVRNRDVCRIFPLEYWCHLS